MTQDDNNLTMEALKAVETVKPAIRELTEEDKAKTIAWLQTEAAELGDDTEFIRLGDNPYTIKTILRNIEADTSLGRKVIRGYVELKLGQK